MKICYLILAHNNFKHLERLINELDDENTTFYIHIDKKTKEEFCINKKNVFIIDKRVSINWGGFSMIEATLNLLTEAKKGTPDADYYGLISGVDYPVRSKEFLNKMLAKGNEYIDILPAPAPGKPMTRYEYRYFDFNRRNVNHLNPKFLLEVLLKKLKIKQQIPFPLYIGTQWFMLSNACVDHILYTVNTDLKYIKYFKRVLVPDEAFFHTIIGNSPYYERTKPCLTFTDWRVPVPPADIEDRHIDQLIEHTEFDDEYGKRYPCFARKFNDNSTLIVDRIKNELINIANESL